MSSPEKRQDRRPLIKEEDMPKLGWAQMSIGYWSRADNEGERFLALRHEEPGGSGTASVNWSNIERGKMLICLDEQEAWKLVDNIVELISKRRDALQKKENQNE